MALDQTDRITIQHVGRGAWRAGCGCGWQTDMFADEEPVSKAVREHSQATGHLMPTKLAIAAKLDELRHHRSGGNATTTDVIRVLEIMETLLDVPERCTSEETSPWGR